MVDRNSRQRASRTRCRRGAIAPLAALFLVLLAAMVAFSVDLGYVLVAKTQMQRSADSAAHAAVLEYRSTSSPDTVFSQAKSCASDYVANNKILNVSATVDANDDVVVGKIDFDYPGSPMTYGNVNEYNAVRVRIRRNADCNGEIPLFFARVLGLESIALEVEATAAIIHSVGGFKIPPSGENVPFLPITITTDYWETELAKATDNWNWDPVNGTVSAGTDGVAEVVLFPSDPDSSGNFGTVNVGTYANSTSHLSNQIRNGLSQADLDFHGGELKLDSNGELSLAGDPGLSAAIKDDLAAIAGQPVAIPLYQEVSGNGNNAVYTIVKFVGVRVMAVNLTGKDKFVSIQPADLTYKGTVQADTGQQNTSQQIYSPPVIVQ